MAHSTKKEPNIELLRATAKSILEDRKAMSDKLKIKILVTIKEFFKNHKNLVTEIFFIQRTTEYDDQGSTLNTGSMNYKPTDILKYLLGEEGTKVFIEPPDDDRDKFQEFNSLNWELKHEDKAAKLYKKYSVPPQAEACFKFLAKLSLLLETLPESIMGEMFGEDKAIFIKSDGTINIERFDPWDY